MPGTALFQHAHHFHMTVLNNYLIGTHRMCTAHSQAIIRNIEEIDNWEIIDWGLIDASTNAALQVQGEQLSEDRCSVFVSVPAEYQSQQHGVTFQFATSNLFYGPA